MPSEVKRRQNALTAGVKFFLPKSPVVPWCPSPVKAIDPLSCFAVTFDKDHFFQGILFHYPWLALYFSHYSSSANCLGSFLPVSASCLRTPCLDRWFPPSPSPYPPFVDDSRVHSWVPSPFIHL